MVNDSNKHNVDYGTKSRNDDPTRNGEDFNGDMSGRFGETTGSSQKTSGTIDDVYKDESVIRGGIEDNNSKTNQTYKTDGSEVDDRQYEKDVRKGMSNVTSGHADDVGSEEEK